MLIWAGRCSFDAFRHFLLSFYFLSLQRSSTVESATTPAPLWTTVMPIRREETLFTSPFQRPAPPRVSLAV